MNLLVATLVLLPLAPDAEPAPSASPRSQLATAIPYALELLKADKHAQFINEFARPDELTRVLESRTIEELVRGFAKDHAAQIIEVLTAIGDAEPKLNAAGTSAEYSLDKPKLSKEKIVFDKVGDYWYLRN